MMRINLVLLVIFLVLLGYLLVSGGSAGTGGVARSLTGAWSFAGPGIEAREYRQRVRTVDIAPTLSLLVGAKPPTGSFGAPLIEVIGQK